jgi:integrase
LRSRFKADARSATLPAQSRKNPDHSRAQTAQPEPARRPARSGCPPRPASETIAGYLGHSVARTTELYMHHHPDYMREAKAALERLTRA